MEAGKLAVQHCVEKVVHALQCKDRHCRVPGCNRIKYAVQHTKVCKKAKRNCPISKQLIAHCSYHAKHCQEIKCPLIFCLKLKQRVKQQQLQQRLQQAQLLRRKKAVMNTRGEGSSSGGEPGGAVPHVFKIPQLPIYSATHQSLRFKPGSQTPPGKVFNVIKQEAVPMEQESQAIPDHPENVAPQLQTVPSPGQMSDSPLIASIESLTLKNQNQVEMPSRIAGIGTGGEGAMPPGVDAVTLMKEQAQEPAMKKQALEQLVQALKAPTSAQQQELILGVHYEVHDNGQNSVVSSGPVTSPSMVVFNSPFTSTPNLQAGQFQLMHSPSPISSSQPITSPVPSPRTDLSSTSDIMLSHISSYEPLVQSSQQDFNDLMSEE